MGREIPVACIHRKYSSYTSSFKNYKCMILLYWCYEVQSSIYEDNQYNVGSERIKVPLCFLIYSISKPNSSLAGSSQRRHKNNCKLWKFSGRIHFILSQIYFVCICVVQVCICAYLLRLEVNVCLSQSFCLLYFLNFIYNFLRIRGMPTESRRGC